MDPNGMDRTERFRWWWPQTPVGSIAFAVLVILSFLTIFRSPGFFWVNIIFWYFVAVLVRFIYFRLAGRSNSPGREEPPDEL